jgi:hypothetical protein
MTKPPMVRRRLLNALFPIGLDALKVHFDHLHFIVVLRFPVSRRLGRALTKYSLNTLISSQSFLLLYHERTNPTRGRSPLFAALRPVSSVI